MSILIKAGAGLVAGVVAGALGLAFLPSVEPTALKPRQAVGKPQFVIAAVPAPAPAVQTTPAVALAAEPAKSAPAAQPAAAPKPEAAAQPTPEAKSSAPDPKIASADARPQAQGAAGSAPSLGAPRSIAAFEPQKAAPGETRAAATASAAPSAPPPVNDAAARLSVRGLIALAEGDLSSARLFLARAAEAGDPRAWVALADTYDPAMLTKLGVVGAPGDAQRARGYLVKAAAAGVVVKDRLAALDQDGAAR